MSFVLDSSATLACIYSDETTDAIRSLFKLLGREGAWVPSLWRLEVANILTTGIRRRRHTSVFRDATLDDLLLLPIRLDSQTDDRAWTDTLKLATRHSLTVYDATYLELAMRRQLPLATLDRELRAAASAEHVTLLGI